MAPNTTPPDPVEGLVEEEVARRPTPPPLPSRREIRQPEPVTRARRARWPAYALLVLSVLVLITGFAAWSGTDQPSESDGREVFENIFDRIAPFHSKQEWEVETFTKTNGQLSLVFGEEHYRMEYTAILKAREPYPAEWVAAMNTLNERSGSSYRQPEYDTRQVKGALFFTKSEQGWKAQDGKLY